MQQDSCYPYKLVTNDRKLLTCLFPFKNVLYAVKMAFYTYIIQGLSYSFTLVFACTHHKVIEE